ncbi:hypothetical protein PENTCL1PPCAC_13921, partial [Pristionchus entomophagus]
SREGRRHLFDSHQICSSCSKEERARREEEGSTNEGEERREERRSPRPRLTRSSARKEEKDQKERERKRSDGEGPDAKRRKIERKKKNTVATVQKDTVSIDEDKENAGVATVTRASKVAQLKPEPYEEINESIFLTQIRDGHDYDGQCSCKDGVCGVSCILRCMTVECDKKTCPSRDNCTNRALQQKKNVKLEVFHTGTEKGFGVRALEPIMKGGFIMEFIGEVMTNTMGEKRSKQYARQFPTRRHQYMMTVTDWRNCPYIIDSTKFGNQSRFTNHSCEPNAICDKWSVDGRFRMGLWAKKKIQAGEEITFDYRFLKYGRTVTNCACGTPKCRQYLSS